MDPRLQMAIQSSSQAAELNDVSSTALLSCWRICADSRLTKMDLIHDEGLSDTLSEKVSLCNRKCIARHFEVLQLMMDVRALREKEMIQGLAPGTLTSELL